MIEKGQVYPFGSEDQNLTVTICRLDSGFILCRPVGTVDQAAANLQRPHEPGLFARLVALESRQEGLHVPPEAARVEREDHGALIDDAGPIHKPDG